jgi:hypothetical protein
MSFFVLHLTFSFSLFLPFSFLFLSSFLSLGSFSVYLCSLSLSLPEVLLRSVAEAAALHARAQVRALREEEEEAEGQQGEQPHGQRVSEGERHEQEGARERREIL